MFYSCRGAKLFYCNKRNDYKYIMLKLVLSLQQPWKCFPEKESTNGVLHAQVLLFLSSFFLAAQVYDAYDL